MKRFLIAFCFAILFLYGDIAYAEKYKMELEVEFNNLRSPCTINIDLDNTEIATVSSRNEYKTQINVSAGRHTIRFIIASKGINQALNVNVTEDIKVHCRVNVDEAWPKLYLDKVKPSSVKIIPSRREAEGWHCNVCGQLSDMLFPDCVYCGNKRPKNNVVILSLDFKSNILFSKYNVIIYVDNLPYDKLWHGYGADIECRLPSGKHKIRIQKCDDPKVFGETEVNVQGHTKAKISFEAKRDRVLINSSEQEKYEPSDHYVEFAKSKGIYSSSFRFYVDTNTFTSWSRSGRGRGSTVKWTGTYRINNDGVVTLMYDDGTIAFYQYELDIYLDNPIEVFLPIKENGTVNRSKEDLKDAYERKRENRVLPMN